MIMSRLSSLRHKIRYAYTYAYVVVRTRLYAYAYAYVVVRTKVRHVMFPQCGNSTETRREAVSARFPKTETCNFALRC